MPIVELPDGTELDFPDGMTPAAMQLAIESQFPQFAAKKETSLLDKLASVRQSIREFAGTTPEQVAAKKQAARANSDDGVMGGYVPAASIPEPLGPMMTARNWQRVQAEERAEPLDPRLYGIKPGDLEAKAELEAARQRVGGDAQFARVLDANRMDAVPGSSGETDRLAGQTRTIGETAGDTARQLAIGVGTLFESPANIVAPDSEYAKTLRGVRQELMEGQSETFRAREKLMHDKITSEDGFVDKYVTTLSQLVMNPSLGVSEVVKQLPNFAAMVGVARGSAVAAGGAVGLASRASPTLAIGEAISGGAIAARAAQVGATAGGVGASMALTGGDAAGDTYEALTDPRRTPIGLWRANPDFQSLVAGGMSEAEAIRSIATDKAQIAALITAPLGVLGFMGAEASVVSRGLSGMAGKGMSGREFGKVLGKELAGEQIEEGATQLGANVMQRTVNPDVALDDGVAQAMATAVAASGGTTLGTHAKPLLDNFNGPGADPSRAALGKWGSNGLTARNSQTDDLGDDPVTAPTWAAATAPAAPAPTIADIGAAGSVDEAIAAAQSVVSSSSRSPHATAADIDALEAQYAPAATTPSWEAANAEAAASAGLGTDAGAAGRGIGAGAIDALGVPDGGGIVDAGRLPDAGRTAVGPFGEQVAVDAVPSVDAADAQPALNSRQKAMQKIARQDEAVRLAAENIAARKASREAATTNEDDDWHGFPADTGTLDVPRSTMPQIKAEHRGALTQFLNARGITHEQVEIPSDQLKPTQAEFSLGKVKKAMEFTGGDRSILVSSDGHVLDGHHQWLAKVEQGQPVKAIRLNAPIRELLETVKEFPSAGVDTGSAPAERTYFPTEKPLAGEGLTSYRYKNGSYGHVMIGATDQADALKQAAQSTSNPTADNLEVWNGSEYVSVSGAPTPAPKEKADATTAPSGKVPEVAPKSVAQEAARAEMVATLTSMPTAKLRDVAKSHKRAYMRNAAAELLAQKEDASRVKRSSAMKQRMQRDKRIDPDTDTMLQAIVKMGGINRESARGRFRFAPEEMNIKARIGNLARHVFVKEGGMRVDQAGAAMAELGYVGMDENGKHDQSDWEDLLSRAAGGEEVYTAQGMIARAEVSRAMEMEELQAKSETEMVEIEGYADDLMDWADDNDIVLPDAPDLYLDQNDQPLITEGEIDAYFNDRQAEDAGRADQADSEGQARASAQADPDAGDILGSYTREEVVARQEADAASAKQREAERARLDADAKKKRDRADIDARMDASADNFQLGQSADEALSGQQDIFSAPAPAAAEDSDIPPAFYKKVKVPIEVYIEDEGTYETIEVTADKALASVREDIDNLRALVKCMGGKA